MNQKDSPKIAFCEIEAITASVSPASNSYKQYYEGGEKWSFVIIFIPHICIMSNKQLFTLSLNVNLN